ncbi:MAG TPA: biotin/lipoyl-containing protein [Ohtaekwangia sp.]
MIHATVSNKVFEIDSAEKGFVVNSQPVEWDVSRFSEGHFSILFKNKSYRAEVVKTDQATKTFTIKINGKQHTVELKDKFDMLLEKMGMKSGASGKVNVLKAPMPGLIIDLKVKPGDVVKAGEPLLVLEAMKMENIIKSPGEGEVKMVNVKKGDRVEKNQVLISF